MPFTPLPDELTRTPGTLGDVTDWSEGSSICPNRPLAFAAALSAVSLTLAGKVRFHETGPEINTLAVGVTGTGKTIALHRAQTLLEHAGLGDCLVGGFASPEAVRRTRGRSTPIFWAEEHFDLRNFDSKRTGAILDAAFHGDGQPIVFHGQGTPEGIAAACNSKRFRDILLGTLIVVAASRFNLRDGYDADNVPAALADQLARWRTIREPVEVDITPDADALRLDRGVDRYATHRVMADKLALIFAASECGPGDPKPQITRAAVEWAWKLIDAIPTTDC
jgi:hypothetical protein